MLKNKYRIISKNIGKPYACWVAQKKAWYSLFWEDLYGGGYGENYNSVEEAKKIIAAYFEYDGIEFREEKYWEKD